MFQGKYNNDQKHPADYEHVLKRAWKAGLDKIIITVGTLKEADEAIKFASQDGINVIYDSVLSLTLSIIIFRSLIFNNGLSSNKM